MRIRVIVAGIGLISSLSAFSDSLMEGLSVDSSIIPEDMRYLTAAYAMIFYLAAELNIDFRK